MSGFTTTGSTVITDIEGTPKSILFWRDFTQWLGGMGIVVLFIAVLPTLGVGGRHLFFSEIPGAVKEELKPRIKATASFLWKIYVGISLAEVGLLMLAGLGLYDALCHTFGTVATGGFSPRAASVGAYDSLAVELIIIVFMLLVGTNFSLYFHVLRRAPGRLLRDIEWRAYLVILGVATLLVTFDVLGHGVIEGVGPALRQASFQVVSIMTTTGYGTADFETWPSLSKLLLVALMFIGGCSGSTGGGMKVLRALVLGKFAYHQIRKIFEPHAVISVKLGRLTLREDTLRDILGFFILFVGIFIIASLIMAMLGLDIVSATSAVAATLCNIGPGLGIVGPTNDFAAVPAMGKLVLVACMLLGRLEIYTVMALVVPRFWRG
jgi:trk system potassium uptake protein TrkH